MSGGQINIIPCGPCKAIEKIHIEISNEMTEVKIAKLNIEDSNSLNTPTKYGIRGIPTLLCFVNGEVVATKVGATNKENIKKFISDNIK